MERPKTRKEIREFLDHAYYHLLDSEVKTNETWAARELIVKLRRDAGKIMPLLPTKDMSDADAIEATIRGNNALSGAEFFLPEDDDGFRLT